ncbi:hypothetical protein FPV67DRAFT_1461965 [Lyophyllum atratum]|nr:hypothetical protein FPV67DRAFT_1461965 [Lyophyllum atratum]
MADPLSVAASVVGLITVSGKIASSSERVITEMHTMELIFKRIQQFIDGASASVDQERLSMISLHDLLALLMGCMFVYSKLEKKINALGGHPDADWSLRRTWSQVQHKINLTLMLNTIHCSWVPEVNPSDLGGGSGIYASLGRGASGWRPDLDHDYGWSPHTKATVIRSRLAKIKTLSEAPSLECLHRLPKQLSHQNYERDDTL